MVVGDILHHGQSHPRPFADFSVATEKRLKHLVADLFRNARSIIGNHHLNGAAEAFGRDQQLAIAGAGIDQDMDEAMKRFRRAAEQGHAGAVQLQRPPRAVGLADLVDGQPQLARICLQAPFSAWSVAPTMRSNG